MEDLRNRFTTGGGKIYPGGYVRVLAGNPKTPISVRRKYAEFEGMGIWHPQLGHFGKMFDFTAHVTQDGHLSVRDSHGRFVARISADKAIRVNVYPGFIAYNGYVSHTLGENPGALFPKTFEGVVARWEGHTCIAIDKANSGERPIYLDNSPFTKVTSEFIKHQRVILISPVLPREDGEAEMIYDLAGNRFASVTHFPLSFSKWEPNQPGARSSRSGEYITEAA